LCITTPLVWWRRHGAWARHGPTPCRFRPDRPAGLLASAPAWA